MTAPMIKVGDRGHLIEFYHPNEHVGTLQVRTGADSIMWGYGLNVATWPTYGGQVIQILSCYIDDLEISGTLRTYREMEEVYSYFYRYMQIASQGAPGTDRFNQEPMTFRYPHRKWQMEIVPKVAPGFRKGRDVVAPTWKINCHVIDESGDVDEVAELIIKEAELKARTNATKGEFDENFGLVGKIGFKDENPFSDPNTKFGDDFANERGKPSEVLADIYSKFIPAYLGGDFDSITAGLGSTPSFGFDNQDATVDTDEDPNSGGTRTQQDKIKDAKR